MSKAQHWKPKIGRQWIPLPRPFTLSESAARLCFCDHLTRHSASQPAAGDRARRRRFDDPAMAALQPPRCLGNVRWSCVLSVAELDSAARPVRTAGVLLLACWLLVMAIRGNYPMTSSCSSTLYCCKTFTKRLSADLPSTGAVRRTSLHSRSHPAIAIPRFPFWGRAQGTQKIELCPRESTSSSHKRYS